MEDALAMDIVNSFEEFVHVELDFLGLQVFVADEALIKILLHELEHKRKFALIDSHLPVG